MGFYHIIPNVFLESHFGDGFSWNISEYLELDMISYDNHH